MSDTTVGRISRGDLAARIGEVTVVEALPPMHYDDMRLPGARNLPPDRVDELAATVLPDRDATIVVYCTSIACRQSTAVADRLVALGYHDVSVYAGGKQDWFEAGLPVETGSQTDALSIDASCTLSTDAIDDRLAEWRRVAESATDRQAIDGGLELAYEGDTPTAAELAALADAERSCCSFFRFELTLDRTGTRLRITAPDATSVDELVGAATPAPADAACACCS